MIENEFLSNFLKEKYSIQETPSLYDGHEYGYIYWGLNSQLEIVYIGQTVNFQSRLSGHNWLDPNIHKIFYVKIPKEEMDNLECDLILEYFPIYNKSLPKSEKFQTIEMYQKTDINFYNRKVSVLRIIKENNIENRFGYYSKIDLDYVSSILEGV